MTIDHVVPQGWPAPAGAYSPVVAFGEVVYTSGQLGMDPVRGGLVDGGIGEQVTQALSNIDEALQACGSSLSRALKVTVFLADFRRDFVEFDAAYRAVMPEPRPARTTVGATLPAGLVEIEVVAARER
jgi:2-iminobutanoate/2-iminopropanoate deaminase